MKNEKMKSETGLDRPITPRQIRLNFVNVYAIIALVIMVMSFMHQ